MNFGAIEENYMLNSFKYFYNVPHKFHIFQNSILLHSK